MLMFRCCNLLLSPYVDVAEFLDGCLADLGNTDTDPMPAASDLKRWDDRYWEVPMRV